MALNEPAQGIAYLLKITGLDVDELHSVISDYNVRESKGLLGQQPEKYDGYIKEVIDSLAVKEISVSSLLAKWNTYCYNLKAGYCSPKWLEEPLGGVNDGAGSLKEVVSQEALNALVANAWETDKDSIDFLIQSPIAQSLSWVGFNGSVGDGFTLDSVETYKARHDILDANLFRVHLEKGVTVDGWDGFKTKKEGVLYPGGYDRLTESNMAWPDGYSGDGVFDGVWNAAKRGFEMASAATSPVTGGHIYSMIYNPVTHSSLWPEALLAAAALGGFGVDNLRNAVESYVWVSANSETKRYEGEKEGTWEYDSLANRVNLLAWGVGVARP